MSVSTCMCVLLIGIWYICIQATSCSRGEQCTFFDQPSPVQQTGHVFIQSWSSLSRRCGNADLVCCDSSRGTAPARKRRWSVSIVISLLLQWEISWLCCWI